MPTDADRPARFITFEGGEGTGKSTQIVSLADALRSYGVDVVVTREPGGATGADAIRTLLVEGDPGRWDSVTEALLHFAARRNHLVQTVWPALAAGNWVLCDRFADSTMAYQGYAQGLGTEVINRLYTISVGDFSPDLSLIFDLDPEIGLARAAVSAQAAQHNETRYERMGLAFHQDIRRAFLAIAADNPQRCVAIDASGMIDAIAEEVLAVVQARLF